MSRYKAVIDIGTNSFHLIIAEISGDSVNTVRRERVVMRLGTEDRGVLRHISESEIKKSVEVLNEFRRLAEYYKADLYAVATSAVRESGNSGQFKDALYRNCGIKVDVIDGKTEALYIQIGILNALQISDKKILCVDIGGGSTEIIIGLNGSNDFVHSYKLGAVRLSKMFFPEFLLTPRAIKSCSEYILNNLNEPELRKFNSGYDIAAGASGTIQSVAAVIAAKKHDRVPADLNGFSFTSDEFNYAAETILEFSTTEERKSIPGMEKGRADIIPAGLLILKHIFSTLGITKMTVSGYALREGYLLNILRKQ